MLFVDNVCTISCVTNYSVNSTDMSFAVSVAAVTPQVVVGRCPCAIPCTYLIIFP